MEEIESYELIEEFTKDDKFIAQYKLFTTINKQALFKKLKNSSNRAEIWTIGKNN